MEEERHNRLYQSVGFRLRSLAVTMWAKSLVRSLLEADHGRRLSL